MMEDLVLELKNEIIESLNLEDVKPEDIDADAPLFGSGLGLKDPQKGKEVFESVNVMADFIAKNRTK